MVWVLAGAGRRVVGSAWCAGLVGLECGWFFCCRSKGRTVVFDDSVHKCQDCRLGKVVQVKVVQMTKHEYLNKGYYSRVLAQLILYKQCVHVRR